MHAQKIYSRSPCPNARHPPTQTKSSYRTPQLVKDHVETQRRRFKDQIKSIPSVGGTEASEWTNWRRTVRENRKKNVHRKKHQRTNRRYGVIPPPKKGTRALHLLNTTTWSLQISLQIQHSTHFPQKMSMSASILGNEIRRRRYLGDIWADAAFIY